MELVVKAKHFEGTEYSDHCRCALSKAAKEQFSATRVSESGTHIDIDGAKYKHQIYTFNDFMCDDDVAESVKYSEQVIRTIELTPIN